MLKYLLFGIGFIMIFEGIVYFLFSKNIGNFYKILNSLEPEKIRFFSSILIIVGLCLIYYTLKTYKL